jgi:hypothetical protein
MAPSGVAISVNSDRLDRSFLLVVVGLSFFRSAPRTSQTTMLCCADEQAVATGHEGGMKSGLALPGKKGLCLITSGANGEKNVRKIIKVRCQSAGSSLLFL